MPQHIAVTKGTSFYAGDRLIGMVKQIEHDGAKQAELAYVRSEDGQWHYRFPLDLVQHVERRDGHKMAWLALTPRDLVRFRVTEDALPARRVAATVVPNGDVRIPLATEELTATTRPMQRGIIHLHKGVETQQQQIAVPVSQETAIIERIPADQWDATQPLNPDEIVIPITEERLVIHKETVITEYICVRKQRTIENQVVNESVRREVLSVIPDPAPDVANDAPPLVQIVGEDYETVP